MLPKNKRLTREEFSRVFSVGKRKHNTLFQCITVPADTLKAAVVVSKKVHKLAVKRNRLRRQLYGILDSVSYSGHIIIIVKPTIVQATAQAVREEMMALVSHSR